MLNGGLMKIKSIILLLGISLIAMNFLYAQDFKEVEKTFKLDKNGTVNIDTYKGEIFIETWEKDEVYVYAKMIPDDGGFWSTKPAKQLSRVDVQFDSSPNTLYIESKYKKNNSWFGSDTRAFVNYKIKMPRTAKLNVKDYKSESHISGIESSINFETYKGEVNISELNGSIDLETYKGEIDVHFSQIKDNCSFETYKGEINISLPKSSSFSVDADLGRKTDFYSGFNIEEDSYKRSRKEYNIKKDVNGGGPTIHITSSKGRIELIEK